MRENLCERYDFNTVDAFMSIQKAGANCPMHYELIREFVLRNGENLKEADLLGILRRFDKD